MNLTFSMKWPLANKLVACTRKVRYGHMETAQKAVADMAAKGKDGLEAYACSVCLGFHIGHPRRIKLTINKQKGGCR